MIDTSAFTLQPPVSDSKPANTAGSKSDSRAGGFDDAMSSARNDRSSPNASDKQASDRGSDDAVPEDDANSVRDRLQGDQANAHAQKNKLSGSTENLRTHLSVYDKMTKAGDDAAGVKQVKAEQGKKRLKDADEGEVLNGKPASETDADAAAADAKVATTITALDVGDAAIQELAKAVAKENIGVTNRADEKTNAKSKASNAMEVLASVNADSDAEDLDVNADPLTVRFSSSRASSGRDMNMSIRSSGDGVEFKVSDAKSGAMENVTVLDSRRFIGLSMSTNASALTSLIAGDPEWVSAMQPGSELSNAAAQSSTGRVVHTLKLQMTPIDLGTVTMSLRMVGDELNVHVTVQNTAAYRKLSDDSKSIVEALRAQGLTVDQITLNISSTEKSDQSSSQNNGQQAQQNNQQALSDRNQNESGRQRGQFDGQGDEGERDVILEGNIGGASGNHSSGLYL